MAASAGVMEGIDADRFAENAGHQERAAVLVKFPAILRVGDEHEELEGLFHTSAVAAVVVYVTFKLVRLGRVVIVKAALGTGLDVAVRVDDAEGITAVIIAMSDKLNFG